jgi:hypothetical protein
MMCFSRRAVLCAFASSALVLHASVQAEAATPLYPVMDVYLSPTCGCCKAWVTHVEKAGFTVRVTETQDLAGRKLAAGVPDSLRSCHTAIVDGYFIEGHVPAADIIRLLRERPTAFGLAVPDMPVGSPGMEVPGVKPDAFDTLLVLVDGGAQLWARHGG